MRRIPAAVQDEPPRPSALRLPREAAATVRDLRGGARLAVDGVRRAIGGLEGLHQRLAQVEPPVRGMRVRGPQRGWPAVLYRGLRGTTDLLGGGLDLALASAQASLQDTRAIRTPSEPMPGREALVAALNGLAGDHLHRTDNPLAIPLALSQRDAPTRPRVLVLVHDLGLDALQWRQQGHDHGQSLGAALDCTPLYASYNSGRHVWATGRELAAELETRLSRWPVALEGAWLMGHGLGGLVLRSALHQALRSGMAWPGHVRHLVFLGTPLQGAAGWEGRWPFAQGGLATQALVGPLARLAGRPSDGMQDFTDGRYLELDGAVLQADPLPAGLAGHAIAGAIGAGLDDGLVPVASALGQDALRAGGLPLADADCWTVAGTGHMGLLGSEAVHQKVRHWLSA
jgi:hypothetical protein